MINKICFALIALWSVFIIIFWSYNQYSGIKNAEDLALIEARALFNKDKATRFWISKLGGVYAPADIVEPNPFLLHIADRDVNFPDGTKYTLVNPAYMLRLMMEDFEEDYGVRGHITSLIHYRPETAPDEWEKKALTLFEAGKKEIIEVSSIENKPFLRLMQPLNIVESCLKCHGVQGYKAGDIRGGVSLSVPLTKYYELQNSQSKRDMIVFFVIWVFGVLILLYTRKIAKSSYS